MHAFGPRMPWLRYTVTGVNDILDADMLCTRWIESKACGLTDSYGVTGRDGVGHHQPIVFRPSYRVSMPAITSSGLSVWTRSLEMPEPDAPDRAGSALCRRSLLGGLVLLMGAATTGRLFAQDRLDQGSVADTVQNMNPGDYLWAPEASPDGPLMIVVSLEKQRAFVYRNGVLIGVSTVSTGAPGHTTPTGIFTILQKKVDHRSNLYNDAPMPFMQRLTWSGVAMHAGHLPGFPASHGCIRLPFDFAQKLFAITQLGLTVIITDAGAIPRFAPGPSALEGRSQPDESEMAGPTSWHPDRAPTGPVSVIISTHDQRVVILRNGILIGSARVTIKEPIAGVHAFTLSSIDAAGNTHWLRVSLLGDAQSGEVTNDERARLVMPEEFRREVRSILQPGATVLVTSDSLQSGSTGSQLTVLTGEDPK